MYSPPSGGSQPVLGEDAGRDRARTHDPHLPLPEIVLTLMLYVRDPTPDDVRFVRIRFE